MKIQREKIKLCPNCKTGRDSIKLDPKEPVCPYLSLHNGEHCIKYVPMNSIPNEGDKIVTEN